MSSSEITHWAAFCSETPNRWKFNDLDSNVNLNSATKLAALKISSSVVSLVSLSGGNELFQCTGTIVESNYTSAVILTSAHLVRCSSGGCSVAPDLKIVVHLSGAQSFDGELIVCDFHYHLAAIKIQPYAQLTPASVAYVNDSLPMDPSQISYLVGWKSTALRPHSNSFILIPGDSVIAVGRYFEAPYQLMAAPGMFRSNWNGFGFDCKELFKASCKITRSGTGGPLVNCFGDVIGLCFQCGRLTPFLPINIVLAWWKQYKKYGELRRPWLGMQLINLNLADLEVLEIITRDFPNVSRGIYVVEVTPGSCADAAGIKHDDVIIEFGGRAVGSVVELVEESWKKVGEVVEVVVVRAEGGLSLQLSMTVGEVSDDKFYSWMALK